MSEYVLLLGLVCLSAASAIAGLGPGLVASFVRAQTLLIAPFP